MVFLYFKFYTNYGGNTLVYILKRDQDGSNLSTIGADDLDIPELRVLKMGDNVRGDTLRVVEGQGHGGFDWLMVTLLADC